MKNYIYCTTTAKGEQTFYLMAQGTKYFLFVQAYRRSNKEVFGQGISLFDLRKLKKHCSYSVRHTIQKLPAYIAYTLIDEFEKAGDLIFKPNIIFKVKSGVNRFEEDKNYDLLKKSLLCTAKKMIPTYVLCDSEPNKNVDAEKLAII